MEVTFIWPVLGLAMLSFIAACFWDATLTACECCGCSCKKLTRKCTRRGQGWGGGAVDVACDATPQCRRTVQARCARDARQRPAAAAHRDALPPPPPLLLAHSLLLATTTMIMQKAAERRRRLVRVAMPGVQCVNGSVSLDFQLDSPDFVYIRERGL